MPQLPPSFSFGLTRGANQNYSETQKGTMGLVICSASEEGKGLLCNLMTRGRRSLCSSSQPILRGSPEIPPAPVRLLPAARVPAAVSAGRRNSRSAASQYPNFITGVLSSGRDGHRDNNVIVCTKSLSDGLSEIQINCEFTNSLTSPPAPASTLLGCYTIN